MKKTRTIDKNTQIIITDTIDTPYPYCVIPKKHFSELSESLEKSVDRAKTNQGPRSLLSVTTWDGRELFDLRSVLK